MADAATSASSGGRQPRWYDGAFHFLKRRVLYRIARPRSPRYPVPLRGPALVVGSAPISNRPAGLDDTFTLITVNGSQSITTAWGLPRPHVTFMQFAQIEGQNDNAVAVRRVLTGQSTGHLYLIRWHKSMALLRAGLARFDYRYKSLHSLSRYHRMALHEDVMGYLNPEDSVETRYSNGVTAVLYALNSKAPAVIIAGIDPGSGGHAYNDLGLKRMHSACDRETLLAIHARGFPLYTSDPHVADSLGLPLWTGQIRE